MHACFSPLSPPALRAVLPRHPLTPPPPPPPPRRPAQQFLVLYKRGGPRVLINRLGDMVCRPTYAESAIRTIPGGEQQQRWRRQHGLQFSVLLSTRRHQGASRVVSYPSL